MLFKVRSAYLRCRDGAAESSEIAHVVNAIHAFDVIRLHILKSEAVESAPRQFGVVTDIGEQLGQTASSVRGQEVARFAIQRQSCERLAEHAAREVLMIEPRKHQSVWDGTGLIQ